MKIDPNQLVGGAVSSELHGETEHGDRCWVTLDAVGDTPPRLEIAKHILAGYVGSGRAALCPSGELQRKVCRAVVEWADALIAAHNATAGEASK